MFTPTHQVLSVGASGALFGLVGLQLVDIVRTWEVISNRTMTVATFGISLVLNFAVGLLPFIDNFAHAGGFVGGALVSLLIIPHIHRKNTSLKDRLWVGSGAIFLFIVALAAGAVLLFGGYAGEPGFCPNCQKFNCIDFVDGLCDAEVINPNITAGTFFGGGGTESPTTLAPAAAATWWQEIM